jgi:alkylated DNA nucleotide flippase Atl1
MHREPDQVVHWFLRVSHILHKASRITYIRATPTTRHDSINMSVVKTARIAKTSRVIKKPLPSEVTPFQRAVYDLCSQVPEGKVTTYGRIAKALNSSPRAGSSPGSWLMKLEMHCVGIHLRRLYRVIGSLRIIYSLADFRVSGI